MPARKTTTKKAAKPELTEALKPKEVISSTEAKRCADCDCDRKLSANFALKEFTVSAQFPELVECIPARYIGNVEALARDILQPIRDALGMPMQIISGYRGPKLNRAVGGSITSQHASAQAADFTVGDRDALIDLFCDMADKKINVPCGQVILYPHRNFIHVALPGDRYKRPSFHVHAPHKGFNYRVALSSAQVRAFLEKI